MNGVYCIKVDETPVYVGESADLAHRQMIHEMYCRSAAEGRYGGDWKVWIALGKASRKGKDISFEVLEQDDNFTKKERLILEKHHIYRIETTGTPLPLVKQHRPHTRKTKAKISASRTGVSQGTWQWSDAARASHSARMMNNRNASK